MREVSAVLGKEIFLGRCGEHMASCVMFDITEWKETHGEGVVHLLHQRNGDKQPYPCVVETVDEFAVWTVTQSDVATAGRGRAELQYFVGDSLIKSETYSTVTERALGPSGDTPPPPEASWVEQVLSVATDVAEITAIVETAEANIRESEQNADEHQQNAKDAAERAEEGANTAQAAANEAVASMDMAEYHANRAQAEAERATVPAVDGVYNVILADRVTDDRYALLVEEGRLVLLSVSTTVDATDLTLIDGVTGAAYVAEVENGRLNLKEV